MNIKTQQGMSLLGMLMTVILVVAVMLLAMKLVPVYINDYAIGKAVASLQSDSSLYNKGKSEIRGIIRRKLTADYAGDLKDETIMIKKNKNSIIIDVVYEARVPVVANIDLVAKFSHHFDSHHFEKKK